MREIKFRAKGIRENKDKWFVGSLFVEDGMGITYIVSGVNTHYETNYLQVEVDSQTVGQYTGLKDAGGREIYEGDVLNNSYGHLGVSYKQEWAAFVARGIDAIGYYHEYLLDEVVNTPVQGLEIKVIGNIHDNPELLEATE